MYSKTPVTIGNIQEAKQVIEDSPVAESILDSLELEVDEKEKLPEKGE